MSSIEEKARARASSGPAWVAAGAVLTLLAAAWTLGEGGANLPAISGESAAGAYDGAWLSQIVVWIVTHLPVPLPPATLLSLFSALALGALLAWLYQRLVFNDWPVVEALVFVMALGVSAPVFGPVFGY